MGRSELTAPGQGDFEQSANKYGIREPLNLVNAAYLWLIGRFVYAVWPETRHLMPKARQACLRRGLSIDLLRQNLQLLMQSRRHLMTEVTAQTVMAVARNNPEGATLLGTAFWLGGGKFATAAHLLSQTDSNLVLVVANAANISDYQDTTNSHVNFITARIFKYDPIADVAILEAANPLTGTTPPLLVGTDEVGSGTDVFSLGYPHCGDGRLVLTLQSTAVGARVLLPVGPLKMKNLVLNILTRPGQSGSPVFIRGTNKICAMILGAYAPPGGRIKIGGVDPAALHQTTHAVSAEYIKAML